MDNHSSYRLQFLFLVHKKERRENSLVLIFRVSDQGCRILFHYLILLHQVHLRIMLANVDRLRFICVYAKRKYLGLQSVPSPWTREQIVVFKNTMHIKPMDSKLHRGSQGYTVGR